MFSVIQLFVIIALLYYSTLQVLLIPILLGANYLLLRRLLISKKQTFIFAKAIRPCLWLLVSFGYIYTVHLLFLIPIIWFVLLSVVIMLGYCAVIWQDISLEPNVLIENTLSLILVFLGISFASLLLAFWHWPVAIVLLMVWLFTFFVAITWLLDFSNTPQLLSSLWALMCVELFWIMSRWINLYHLPKTNLLVSQAALTIAALAYGFGGIYFHYKKHSLRNALIIEYISVTAVIFIALILLSKWAIVV